MKNKLLRFIICVFIISAVASTEILSQKKGFKLIEEDRNFWDNLLGDNNVSNKNLLYASYVAYKDLLNDLSIETFNECIKSNEKNQEVIGIANYYIGKNYYNMGKYNEALTQFLLIDKMNLLKFDNIKVAAHLNSAITYYQLSNNEKCREYCLIVIAEDNTGPYKKLASEILTQIK